MCIRDRDGDRVFELYAQTYQINQPLSKNVFEIPEGVPLLPPNP